MKIIIIFCSFYFAIINSFAQCSIDDILLIDISTTKFKALKELQLKENVVLVEQPYKTNYWYKPDYIKGDSVYRSSLIFTITDQSCFNDKIARMYCKFADDILFSITISVDYDTDDFKNCYDTYKEIASLLKPKYEEYYETEFKRFSRDIEPEESNGEVTTFSSGPEIENNMKETSLSYCFEYEYKWNTYKKTYEMTGNFERILLEFTIIDLTIVKLDNRGY